MNVPSPLNRRPSRPAHLLPGLAAPLAAAILMALPAPSFARVFVSIDVAPPPLVVYEQPAMPGNGYLWTPGYWAYGDAGYFWVPGTWVRPPYALALWTPGYWGWGSGRYAFHSGYWGRHVGFYGGINYGYGNGGMGYQGGYWRHGGFFYNRGVNNFGTVHVTNVYERTVVVNNVHVSFNGGTGGINARPNREEMIAVHERHTGPNGEQQQHVRLASQDRNLSAAVNHGSPAVAATAKPGVFAGDGVVKGHEVNAEDRDAVTKAEHAKPAVASVQPTKRMAHRDHSATDPAGAIRSTRADRPEHGARPTAQPHPARQVAQQHVSQRHAPAPRKEGKGKKQDR